MEQERMAFEWKDEPGEVQVVDGLKLRPLKDFIYVASLGQPDMSEGGLYLGDDPNTFGRYKHSDSRYGIVIAIGPGRPVYVSKLKRVRYIVPGVKLGDVVLFSRRMGSRLGGGIKFKPEGWGFKQPLYIRVLDTDKIAAIVEDFKPWWNVEESQLDPDGIMTG